METDKSLSLFEFLLQLNKIKGSAVIAALYLVGDSLQSGRRVSQLPRDFNI